MLKIQNRLLFLRSEDDITVVLGSDNDQETIKVTVEVLSSLSPVFRVMMEAPMAEARERIVRLPDVDSRAFEILLSNKRRDTKGFLTPLNSVNTALGLLSFCRKYLITDIKSETVAMKYLQKNIHPDNVLFVLQHIKLMNQTLPLHDTLGPQMNFLIKVLIMTDYKTDPKIVLSIFRTASL